MQVSRVVYYSRKTGRGLGQERIHAVHGDDAESPVRTCWYRYVDPPVYVWNHCSTIPPTGFESYVE